MPVTNLSSITFTAAETTSIQQAIAAINQVINAKTTNLSPKEKQLYGSIAAQNKLVVQKIGQYAVTNPAIVPQHADVAELSRDSASRNQLEIWEDQVALLLSNIQNAKNLLDFDVYQTTLTIYRNVRYQAGENVPGMSAIYQDMKQFFPGGGGTPEAGTTAPAN